MPKPIADARILEAAVATVAEHGYAGATTRQIANAAGVAEVTLFRRFGSKARLLREALLRELAVFEDQGGAEHTGNLRADLERMVSLYLALVGRNGRLIPVLLAELPRRPELADVVEVPQRVILSVAAVIERYQREGQLVAEPPYQAVAALFAPLMVTGLMHTLFPALPLPRPSIADHVHRFLEGRTATDDA